MHHRTGPRFGRLLVCGLVVDRGLVFLQAPVHTQGVKRWGCLLAGLCLGCASGDDPATSAATTFTPTASATASATITSGSADDPNAGADVDTDADADNSPETGDETSAAPSTDTDTDAAGTSGGSSSGGPPSEQPEQGMYSPCDSIVDCIGLTACLTATDAGGQPIEPFCTSGACKSPLAQCDPTPGGTAVPVCLPTDTMDNVCALDCSQGQECPVGMDCRTLAGGSICS